MRESGKPLVSLITVVYNGASHLEEAMQSVFSQSYPNIEYIVIDGGSTDGSIEIIKQHRAMISHWISEPDHGIYDAMNKGLLLASGEISGFVNADDGLYPETISLVVDAFVRDPAIAYVYGSVDLTDRQGAVIGQTHPFSDAVIRQRYRLEMPFPHPALFVASRVYRETGPFDTSLPLSADYDFMIRMIDRGFYGARINKSLARFRKGGRSDGLASFIETRRLHKKHKVNWLTRNSLFVSSALKLLIYRAFPLGWVSRLKCLRKKSRHTFRT